MRQDTVQDNPSRSSGNRATVYEAAEALGVTVDAIRKRIQRGTIAHKRDGNGRVYVLLDKVSTLRDRDKDTYQTSQYDLVESLRDQIVYLRNELRTRSEELRRKDHIIAALTDRISELEAPQGATERRQTASVSSEGAEPTQEGTGAQKSAQRPWWRRVLGG
jgi:excisionase family DNA binding protein